MTKALGIDIGSSFIHLVELDGSSRRFTVSRMLAVPRSTPGHLAGELDSEAQPVGSMSELERDLGRAIDEFGAGNDRTVLCVRGSACILRTFTVPFRGRDEIRKVLKFESEGQIHSHSIDDVVVDAAIVAEGADGTDLFMAACPKATLGPQLDLLATHGISPERADLDCALLFEAAKHTGALEEGEEDDIDLLLGVGQSAIQLVLARGGRLATARVLRWGLDNLEAELASTLSSDAAAVHDAMHRYFGLPTAADIALPGEHIESGEDDGEEELIHTPLPIGISVHEDELLVASRRLAQRLKREVFRFLAGLKESGTLRKIVLTGGGARLPGISDMLAEELELEVSVLDLLGRTTDSEGDPGMDTALAAAMTALGVTKPTMNFRQEELAYRRRFDVLKVPIAVAVWLLLGFVVLTCINLTTERSHIELVVGVPRAAGPNDVETPTPRYTGLFEQLGSPIKTSSYVLTRIADDPKRAQQILEVVAREETPGGRVSRLRSELEKLKKHLQEETGYFPGLKLQSGLAVLQAFSEVVDAADKAPSIGRFVITEIDMDLSGSEPHLNFRIGFRGEDFRQQHANFEQICKEALGGNGPFAEWKPRRGEDPFSDVIGASYDEAFILAKDFGVFQPTSF